MEQKAKRTSLITSIGLIFGISVMTFLITLLALGYNLQRYQLKKEAALLSNEVLAFNQWIGNTAYAKNHALETKEKARIHSEATKSSTFKIVSDNPGNKLETFEANAIDTFKKDNTRRFIDTYDVGTYRYAQPLIMTDDCLKCHTKYKAGDVGGIIAVNLINPGVFPHIEIRGFATYLTGIIAIIALLVNFVWFKSRVIGPLGVIDSALKEVREGNYNTRINITTKDEFGDISDTFNTTMDKLTTLIQTDEEKKQMQKNIIKFLDILSAASDGDLTQKAEVTPDIFGSLGDAYNLMVDGLTGLIDRVRKSVEDVNTEGMKIVTVLKEMESGASAQMQQVRKATESVNESAMSASSITDKTMTAQEISENALIAIGTGSKAVESSIEGMQLIRLTIQAINKRMKYLSERLMEIVTISHLINEIANRTNILAINASIEAARAGEQGKGFVVISEEIRSLAERAAKSTKQITDIINAVQTESAVVTKHLEEETKYVEVETKTAADTETAFKEIEKTIKDMSSIISDINLSAGGQKKLTSDVVVSMDEVQMISVKVLKLVHEFTEISKSLSETSNAMRASIERFKLPEAEAISEE